MFVSWQFSGPYGVTKYGSGWRKDVVNQCLEFLTHTHAHTLTCQTTVISQITNLILIKTIRTLTIKKQHKKQQINRDQNKMQIIYDQNAQINCY